MNARKPLHVTSDCTDIPTNQKICLRGSEQKFTIVPYMNAGTYCGVFILASVVFQMLASDTAISDDFSPSILKRVNLQDTALKATPGESSWEVKPSPPPLRTFRSCQCCSTRSACVMGDGGISHETFSTQMRRRLGNGRERPKLVSADEFHDALMGMARRMANTQDAGNTSGVSKGLITHPVSAPPERLSTVPLIEAFRRAASSSAGPSVGHSSRGPLSSKSSSQGPESPPLTVVVCRVEEACLTESRQPTVLGWKDSVRLVRILEKICARRIWRVWKRYRIRQRRLEQRILETLKKENERTKREMLKEVALSALSNSRQIREELIDIRTTLNDGPPTTVHASSPLSGPKACVFKSGRVLLKSSVQSPASMDRFLATLTPDRSAVRLCMGQSTLHARAFVVVLVRESISESEWRHRLATNAFVEALDSNFPFAQTTQPGLPWEVRVRSDMALIVPNWEYLN